MPTLINGEECLNTGESAQYLGISTITLNRKIEEYNKEHPEDDERIPTLENRLRSQAKYYRKSDLDKLKGFQVAE